MNWLGIKTIAKNFNNCTYIANSKFVRFLIVRVSFDAVFNFVDVLEQEKQKVAILREGLEEISGQDPIKTRQLIDVIVIADVTLAKVFALESESKREMEK